MRRGASLGAHVGLVVVALTLSSCTTVESPPAPPASTPPVPTPPAAAADDPMTVEAVVARQQAGLQARFDASEPPPGVLGPFRITCDRSGAVDVGEAIACLGVPQTEPGFPLDEVGVVLLVVDETGNAALVSGTDVPGDEAALGRVLALEAPGDCVSPLDPQPERQIEARAYFWVLARWYDAGSPSGVDPDGDGLPCTHVFSAEAVASVLLGGPVG